MRPLGNETVFIRRAPLVTDPRDNTKYRDWANPVDTQVVRCMVEPFPMAEKLNFEDNKDREFGQSSIRFYLPKGTDVVYTDRVVWKNEVYEILGHKGNWITFGGLEHHVTVIGKLRRG